MRKSSKRLASALRIESRAAPAEMSRLVGLDALRGVAALLVFVHHFLYILAERGHDWAGSIVFSVDLGKFGVSLFFLISGFVIPFSLQRGIAAFWIGRAARLLPALWLSILFCVALGADLESGAQLLANAFMVAHATGQLDISPPYWTLNWELYFYAIVAGACALGWLKNPRTFGLLAFAAVAAFFFDRRATYLLFMFTGALLRMVLLAKDEAAKRWLCVTIGLLTLVVFFWAKFGPRPPEFFAGLALALPVFVLCWNRAAHPLLIWLGGISYSLYLFHLPILETLAHFPISAPVFILLGLSLPIIVAALVFRWVERLAIDWGKGLARQLSDRRQNALPQSL